MLRNALSLARKGGMPTFKRTHRVWLGSDAAGRAMCCQRCLQTRVSGFWFIIFLCCSFCPFSPLGPISHVSFNLEPSWPVLFYILARKRAAYFLFQKRIRGHGISGWVGKIKIPQNPAHFIGQSVGESRCLWGFPFVQIILQNGERKKKKSRR